MPDKSQETYERFWDALKAIGDFQPESCRLDFEKAISKSIIKIFGEDLNIYYCLFHLSQSCMRKVCEKHQKRYRDPRDPNFSTRCRMIPALAFIPVEEVVETFEELVKYDKENGNLLPPECISHFEKYYIGKPIRRNIRQIPR